jgi:hypothetical protein
MRHRRRGDRIGRAAVLGLVLLGSLSPAATAAVLDELRGAWAMEAAAPRAMEWAAAEDGFAVSWTPPGAEAITVHFTPAGRPGVYGGVAKAGWSIMSSMFGDEGPVNPLEKGPLFWARTAEDTIYLYRLAISDQGVFEIDRYACHIEGGGLAVSLVRRTADGMAEPVEQRLVRIGK